MVKAGPFTRLGPFAWSLWVSLRDWVSLRGPFMWSTLALYVVKKANAQFSTTSPVKDSALVVTFPRAAMTLIAQNNF